MSIYVNEVRYYTTFDINSYVTFVLNTGEQIVYKINPGFLCENYGRNDRIFTILGIKNKYEYIKSIVGYRPNEGVFPLLRNMGDLKKVIEALAEYRPKENLTSENLDRMIDRITNKKEEKFILSVKKHKPTKLNFKL